MTDQKKTASQIEERMGQPKLGTPRPASVDRAACSNCGHWDSTVRNFSHIPGQGYYVTCMQCGRATPTVDMREKAVEVWNSQNKLSQVAPADERAAFQTFLTSEGISSNDPGSELWFRIWQARGSLADARPMVDMVPPATSRDRWVYEQDRLAERDPRTPKDAPTVSVTVPDGWRLVPVAPTREMIDAYVAVNLIFSSAKADWAAMLNAAPTPPTSAEHHDDDAVDRFAEALKEKLAQARAKGRSGWHECDPVDLSKMLREHVEKGDPRDVANFCMFLWSLGQPISPGPTPTRAPDYREVGHD